jgi:thiol-disulfide isomerase/thioredoxin
MIRRFTVSAGVRGRVARVTALLAVLATFLGSTSGHAGARIAADFSYEDINPNSATFGQRLSLSELYSERGLVLNFLASWCGFCWKELPELDRIGKTTVAPIVGVAADEYEGSEKLVGMVREAELSFPILLVPGEDIDAMGEEYAHQTLPATYLIDKRGRIRVVFQGLAPEKELMRQIRNTLQPEVE